MKMTKIGMAAAICGLVLAGAGATHAQGAKGKRAALRGSTLKQKGGKHEGAMAQMLAQLNLTPDQKKQIATIAEGAKKQGMSIKQNASLSAADKKMQEKALGKETRKQIVAVLTPAQKQQLKQLIAQRKAAKTGSGATATPGTTAPVTPPAATSPKTGAITPAGNGSVATADTKTEDDELDGLDELA